MPKVTAVSLRINAHTGSATATFVREPGNAAGCRLYFDLRPVAIARIQRAQLELATKEAK